MPIPDMPSMCQIWGPWDAPVLIAFNVPCRLVPSTGRRPFGAEFPWFGYGGQTHWIDLLPGLMIQTAYYNFDTTDPLEYQISPARAYLFVVCQADFRSFYVALWATDRYVNTASHHTRVYCRLVTTIPAVIGDPC